MAGTWDQERQRTEEFREEQLDWLHQQHEEMTKQTQLLDYIAISNRTTQRYVGWLLAIAVVPIVLSLIILVGWR